MALDLFFWWGGRLWGGNGNVGVEEVHGGLMDGMEVGAVVEKELVSRRWLYRQSMTVSSWMLFS